MTVSIHHIAVWVPDLRTAEAYYRTSFEMQLIGRETLLQDGLWYTLPADKNWEDARAAGIDLGMCALRKGDFVLALFQGQPILGQVYAIGLEMPVEEITRLRARLSEDTLILEDGPSGLTFRDPYQIIWQVSAPGIEFRSAGEFADRWLKL